MTNLSHRCIQDVAVGSISNSWSRSAKTPWICAAASLSPTAYYKCFVSHQVFWPSTKSLVAVVNLHQPQPCPTSKQAQDTTSYSSSRAPVEQTTRPVGGRERSARCLKVYLASRLTPAAPGLLGQASSAVRSGTRLALPASVWRGLFGTSMRLRSRLVGCAPCRVGSR
jgi:hypothetical protein